MRTIEFPAQTARGSSTQSAAPSEAGELGRPRNDLRSKMKKPSFAIQYPHAKRVDGGNQVAPSPPNFILICGGRDFVIQKDIEQYAEDRRTSNAFAAVILWTLFFVSAVGLAAWVLR